MSPRRTASKKSAGVPEDKLLSKLTMVFFRRPWLTGLTWLTLLVFGILSYVTLLPREGFPSVNIPLVIVNGTYIVNDPAKVDTDVAKTISDLALKNSAAKTVQAQSQANFFNVTIQYKEGTDAAQAAKELQTAVDASKKLPATADVRYNTPNFGATGPDTDKIDIAVSFYDKSAAGDTLALRNKANDAATYLNQHKPSLVEKYFVQDPFVTAMDPTTGQDRSIQKTFARFGDRQGSTTEFYNSVIIGVTAVKGADVIELDNQVRAALGDLSRNGHTDGYATEISAGFASQIRQNISELQRVLLEGLLAVLVVGSVVIAIRASIITVASMVSVIAITVGLLYVVGYSLNVITLFALILGLSLVVDDTIIMVEALDVARKRQKNADRAVEEATRKVSRAMVAATTTAALSFAPLIFVSGVLGSFIRAIPITIISSLAISLLVALIFIPFFARRLLLGKKQMGEKAVKEMAAGIEHAIAEVITKPMLWARGSYKKLTLVGVMAIIIGFGFIGAAGMIAKHVVFNIFPPTKDTDGVIVSVTNPPGTTLEGSETIEAKASQIAADVIGSNFVRSSTFNTGTASGSTLQVEITPYGERDITAPEIVKQLEARYKADFKDAVVQVGQVDVGPPAAAFTVQIAAENRSAAFQLANDMATYLKDVELKRPSGTIARIRSVTVSSPDQYVRTDGSPNVTVGAIFEDTDTSTLVTLAQDAIKKEFNTQKIQSYGLPSDAVKVDLGQESENQDSFKTLAIAFPILLAIIYVLLAIQFRSLLQPALIFLAIPFSLFGVMLGLYLTDNPISFFSMLGFFALIGLSLKNTILLTDYANQARRAGMDAIDAAHAAVAERFRPLIATSLTAVVSLIPLAIASPFWQGLAVVLIFGLLSSTFLVITVFPYYYLGGEFSRSRVSRLGFFRWLLASALVTVLTVKLFDVQTGWSVGLIFAVLSPIVYRQLRLRGFFRRAR